MWIRRDRHVFRLWLNILGNAVEGTRMSEERETVFGGCRCGAVRYKVVGIPVYAPSRHLQLAYCLAAITQHNTAGITMKGDVS